MTSLVTTGLVRIHREDSQFVLTRSGQLFCSNIYWACFVRKSTGLFCSNVYWACFVRKSTGPVLFENLLGLFCSKIYWGCFVQTSTGPVLFKRLLGHKCIVGWFYCSVFSDHWRTLCSDFSAGFDCHRVAGHRALHTENGQKTQTL